MLSLTIMPRETIRDLETTDSDVDEWGVRKLYASADSDNAQEWYINMANPTSDRRLKNHSPRSNLQRRDDDDSLYVDGIAKYRQNGRERQGNGQVRLEAWSESRNKTWLNTEVTVYGFYMDDLPRDFDQSSTAFQLYSGGGHHSSDRKCDAGGYKIRLMKDGSIRVRKEPLHPFYCKDRGPRNPVTNTRVEGRWIGLKQVRYNFEDNGRVCVANEVWIDEESDENGRLVLRNGWRRVANVQDKGGWGLPESWENERKDKYIREKWKDDCERQDRNEDRAHRKIEDIINMPGGTDEGNLAALRCDGVKLKFKYFSVREIRPPTPD
jgi:hypothetical protein